MTDNLVCSTLLEKIVVTTLTELVFTWIIFNDIGGIWFFPISFTKLPIHKIQSAQNMRKQI